MGAVSETYAFGYVDPRAVRGTDSFNYPPGDMLFRSDAEARGYDLALYDAQVRDCSGIYMPWWRHR